jgi:hypothetical protein
MTALAEIASIARFRAWITRLGAIFRRLGPYLAIEILLPGGTLMALLLWAYRQKQLRPWAAHLPGHQIGSVQSLCLQVPR